VYSELSDKYQKKQTQRRNKFNS